MVLGVAGPEQHRVVPADEAEHVKEEDVEGPRAEDGVVAELVKAVDAEGAAGSVEEDRGGEPVPGEVDGDPPGEGPGRRQGGEVAEGLGEAEEVAAAVEVGKEPAIDAGAVPGDPAFRLLLL